MPLPVFETAEAIPEPFRSEYAQGEDKKWYPKAVSIDEVAGLKTSQQQLLAENKKYKGRLALIGDRPDEEVKADLELAAQAKADRAKATGDFETQKKQLIEQHTGEITKATTRTKKVEGKLFDVLARSNVQSAIKEAEGDEVLLLPHVLPFVRIVEDGDNFLAKVVDANGNVRITNGAGTEMTIKQLVEEFKANPKFEVAFGAGVGSGSGGPRPQSGQPGSGGVIIIPKTATPQEYRHLKEKAEKEGKSYRVAE